MGTKNDKYAQNQKPRPYLEKIGSQNNLKNIGIRFQKEIHKGFANPVEGCQTNAGYNHRFFNDVFRFVCHRVFSNVTIK
jgi:hypothetical protein